MKCIEDEHSLYLHSILKRKVKVDDMRVLNIKEKDKTNVHKQYLKLTKKYHPDKCKDVHSNELFVLITNSFNKINRKEISLEQIMRNFVGENFDYNLFLKVLTMPKELSFSDKLRLTYTIYKFFINKNE